MFKKVTVVALGVAAAMFVLSFTRVGSYMCVGWNKIQQKVESKIPIEDDIAALKIEIARLDKDIEANREPVAEQMVDLKKLNADVVKQREIVAGQRKEIEGLYVSLQNGGTAAAERELEAKLQVATRDSNKLKSMESLLVARQKACVKAKEQFDAMKNQKDIMSTEIATLEAELQELRLAQTEAKVQIDDSRLGSIKERLSKIERRIQVEKTKNELVNTTTTPEKPQKDLKGAYSDYIKSVEGK